jgi:acetyltransferase-like isoleucine patch superfamily enzyme
MRMPNTFTQALDSPWKFYNEVERMWIYPWARLLFWVNGLIWGPGWRIYGIPIIQRHRRSLMTIGARMQLRSTPSSNPLSPAHPVVLCTYCSDATLAIGDDFGMTGGTICAANRITIGDRVTVGANTSICDTDFHPIDPQDRVQTPNLAKTASIRICDNVFIGMNCLVLKGVMIGEGSVVGAGSVVTHDIPPRVIAAGNPARVLNPL